MNSGLLPVNNPYQQLFINTSPGNRMPKMVTAPLQFGGRTYRLLRHPLGKSFVDVIFYYGRPVIFWSPHDPEMIVAIDYPIRNQGEYFHVSRHLKDLAPPRYTRLPIDQFYEALAEAYMSALRATAPTSIL